MCLFFSGMNEKFIEENSLTNNQDCIPSKQAKLSLSWDKTPTVDLPNSYEAWYYGEFALQIKIGSKQPISKTVDKGR